MTDVSKLKVGDRIRLLEPLTNDDTTSFITVEDIAVGTMGTISRLPAHIFGHDQIGVNWDDGSVLSLLIPLDDGKWEVVND